MSLANIDKISTQSLQKSDPQTLRLLSDGCFVAGFVSIAASIGIWAAKREKSESAHAERFGIFVGLWAPTFFILSNRFERYVERLNEENAKDRRD